MSKQKHPRSAAPSAPAQRVQVGVAWYTEQEWAKVRSAALDSERFESSYSEWVAMAEQALGEMLARGVMAEKCYVKSDALLAWCLAHGRPNNAASRAAFVSEVERTAHEGGV